MHRLFCLAVQWRPFFPHSCVRIMHAHRKHRSAKRRLRVHKERPAKLTDSKSLDIDWSKQRRKKVLFCGRNQSAATYTQALNREKKVRWIFNISQENWKMDPEQPRQLRNGPPVSTVLPANHPVNIIYRVTVMFGSIYGLYEHDVFHQIMRGPGVNHEWFKCGLAAGIGEILLVARLRF